MHDANVLHYDEDSELVADVTGQPQEWILPAESGTAEPDASVGRASMEG
jgi:hypothetical protein